MTTNHREKIDPAFKRYGRLRFNWDLRYQTDQKKINFFIIIFKILQKKSNAEVKVEINSEEKDKIVSVSKTYATIKEKCRILISQKIFQYIQ